MLNKLNFCPYEYDEKTGGFRKIEIRTPDDLAYELVFMEGYKIDDLENTSIYAGNKNDDFIHRGLDLRLERYYQDNSNHYMLWEGSPGSNMPSGLSMLIHSIEVGNKLLSDSDNKADDEDIYDEDIYDEFDELDGEEDVKQGQGNKQEDRGYQLEWERQENGKYIFSYASGTKRDEIMEAVPCCPSCHQKLPIGWTAAEDFCGISLMAKKGGGKTTFLLSLMANDWESVRYLGGDWQITPAHDRDDASYKELTRQAETMVSEGKCPPNTRTANLIAPIFLNIDYKGHKMIAGLYDNSGEVLYEMRNRDSRTKMLTDMFAHIYLIEPIQMRVKLMEKKQRKLQRPEPICMPSVQDQGKLQKEHQGEEILAEDLLKVTDTDVPKKKEDPLKMYFRYKDLLSHNLNRLKRQYFCAAIIKCDLLEGLKELEAIPGSRFLFSRDEFEDLLNEDMIKARESIVEKLFDKYVFTNIRQKEVLLRDFENRILWRCISALGCSATENEKGVFYLDDEYQPIRVAEPLVSCLKKKVEENGWDD